MENKQKISLTEQAAAAIKELLEKEDMSEHALRVYIAGAG
jgi:Fe-S cluster assembly iron-binding protein IscA